MRVVQNALSLDDASPSPNPGSDTTPGIYALLLESGPSDEGTWNGRPQPWGAKVANFRVHEMRIYDVAPFHVCVSRNTHTWKGCRSQSGRRPGNGLGHQEEMVQPALATSVCVYPDPPLYLTPPLVDPFALRGAFSLRITVHEDL